MAAQEYFPRLFLILYVFSLIFPLTVSIYVEPKLLNGDSNFNVSSQNLHGHVDDLQIMKALHRMIQTYMSEHPYLSDAVGNGDFGEMLGLNTLDFMTTDNTTSSACVNDTVRLVTGFLARERWAIPFLDAAGKPGPSLTHGWFNFVGNLDQCKSAKAPAELLPSGEIADEFRGGYFQVAFEVSSIPVPIKIGLCLPDSCTQDQVKSIGKDIIKAANVSVWIKYVHRETNATEMTSATILAIIFTSIIGILMIVCTLYDIVVVQVPVWEEERRRKGRDNLFHLEDEAISPDERKTLLEYEKSPHGNNNVLCFRTTPHKDHQGNNYIHKILMAFSVYSNGKKVLDVSQPPNSLQSIHGIRFFSISWVILAHLFKYGMPYSLNAVDAYKKLLDRWTFDMVANGFVSVDTFFALSGLLTCYLSIDQILRKGWKLNWAMFYFHRYWRLTPPYMLVVLIHLGFQQYLIKGTMRGVHVPIDKEMCEKNWWTNLLYINSIVETREMCLDHTWYLSNDMQFFILSPLMMVPFYFHRLAGLCSCFVFLLATWITTGVVSSSNDFPPTIVTLQNIDVEMRNDWLEVYYCRPWCRIGPFVVGVVAGYILAIHKGRPFYMKRWVLVLGWIISTASALAVLFGLRGDISGDDPSSVGVAALYNSVARTVWGGCVCWVIVVCTAGYGGPINAFLSWSPFVVLGRLSFMVYLIHFPMIFIFFENLDMPFFVNDTTMVVYFLGFLLFTNLVAFVFMLAIERPMGGLEKAIMKKGK